MHHPDPIIIGQPYTIFRRFRSLLPADMYSLKEEFWGFNRSRMNSSQWSEIFHIDPFDRCGTKEYQTVCPIQPRGEFTFNETHPATSVRLPGEHRSVQHYFVNGQFAGCAVIVYNYEDAASKWSERQMLRG